MINADIIQIHWIYGHAKPVRSPVELWDDAERERDVFSIWHMFCALGDHYVSR